MSDNTTLSKYLINGYNSKVEGVNLIQRLEKAIKENDRDAAIDAAISIGNEVVYFAELLGKEAPLVGGALNTASLIRDIRLINNKLESGNPVTFGDLLSTLSDASGTVAAGCALVGAEPVAFFLEE